MVTEISPSGEIRILSRPAKTDKQHDLLADKRQTSWAEGGADDVCDCARGKDVRLAGG